MTNCLGNYVSSPDAVSDQDFLCVYSDTLTDPQYVFQDDNGGDTPHRPLGIRVKQTSYSFSQAFEVFILIDYEFENIAQNFLKNLYIGLYVDADCGPREPTRTAYRRYLRLPARLYRNQQPGSGSQGAHRRRLDRR